MSLTDRLCMYSFGIHDCCPGGDGRAKGVNVPKADCQLSSPHPYLILMIVT